MKLPYVSIVIPTYKRDKDLFKLLDSIKVSDYSAKSLQVIVVDNGCEQDLRRKLSIKFPNIQLVEPGINLYSNAAFKLGSKHAKGKYIFLLDDDNILDPGCINALVNSLENNAKYGMVGPLMLIEDSDEILSVGGRINSFGVNKYLHMREKLSNVMLPEVITGFDYLHNARMVRREVLEKVPFDDKTFPHNWAETDFSFRITAAGYKLATVTSAIERHMGQNIGWLTRLGPFQTYDQAKSRILFRRRYYSNPTSWLKFWLLVFPLSSLLYFWRTMKQEHNKISIIRSYLKGTRDGLLQEIDEVVN